MLNLLKWSSLDFLHRYLWMFLVAAASLVLAAVVPNGEGFTNALLIFSAAVLGFVFFLACIVLAMYQCFGWLRQDSTLLEMSLPVPAWKQMLSRLIIAITANLLACLGMLVLMLLFGKYTSGTVDAISLSHLEGIGVLTLIFVLVDMTILFSYLISRSIGLSHLWAALITSLLASILLMLIAVFTVYVMLWTNVLMLPPFSMNTSIAFEDLIKITSIVPALLTGLWIILLEYLGSSLLLKYSIQVD